MQTCTELNVGNILKSGNLRWGLSTHFPMSNIMQKRENMQELNIIYILSSIK